MAEKHEMLGGKLQIYKRSNSSYWQCATFLNGRHHRISSKLDSLALAKEWGEDWYLTLRGKARNGEIASGPTFKKAALGFLSEFQTLLSGERSARYIETVQERIDRHLIPFFGSKALIDITPGLVQEYRLHRMKNGYRGKPPSRSTLHNETVALRQVLKFANRSGLVKSIPDLSRPYRTSGKVTHRAWFSPDEYKRLYEATRVRTTDLTQHQGQWLWQAQQLHDYVLFVANTGVRPDEALNLEFRDVQIVREPGSKEAILHLEVRGKRGVGYCKSTHQAVFPFERLKSRSRLSAKASSSEGTSLPLPTDKLFPVNPRQSLLRVLKRLGLRKDREGNLRTAYSLRHSYITFRLMEGADIYAIAKNCRTSVEMIEKFYASHIKNRLDASAINVDRGNIARERRQQKA